MAPNHGNSFLSFGAVPGLGGWVELGRTTLGAISDIVSVGSLADKRYYMVLCDALNSGSIAALMRLNSDTATNYATRRQINGAVDGIVASNDEMQIGNAGATDSNIFTVAYLSNLSAQEKLGIGWAATENASGAGNPPNRQEGFSKHAQTSNPISTIDFTNFASGDFATNSEVVVLGWDPTDIHTTNFWEELASVNASGSSPVLSSGTIPAKKYLWVQGWVNQTTFTVAESLIFNSDEAGDYSKRESVNGAADGTNTNQGSIRLVNALTDMDGAFINLLIINNFANEKLVIGHILVQDDAGAGNEPERIEIIGKWSNTSSQITEVSLESSNAGVNWTTNSIIKVWGSD